MKEYWFTFYQRAFQKVSGIIAAKNKKEAERKIRQWAEEGANIDIRIKIWDNIEADKIKDLELEEIGLAEFVLNGQIRQSEVQRIAREVLGRELTPDEIRDLADGLTTSFEIAYSEEFLKRVIKDIGEEE